MSKHFTRELVAEQAAIVAAPKTMPETDRSFELPKGLYIATVGLYLGFLAVMAAGLSTPGLIIPMVIFTLFIVAGFGLPALWTRSRASRAQHELGEARKPGNRHAYGPREGGGRRGPDADPAGADLLHRGDGADTGQ